MARRSKHLRALDEQIQTQQAAVDDCAQQLAAATAAHEQAKAVLSALRNVREAYTTAQAQMPRKRAAKKEPAAV